MTVLISPAGEMVYPAARRDGLERIFPLLVQAAAADNLPPAPDSVPPAYKAAMRAKLARDKQSYQAFRLIDQTQHEQRHQAEVQAVRAEARQAVEDWREELSEAEPAAAEALARSRAAEDRARAAALYAGELAEVHRKVKGTGTPQQITSALTIAQNALKTAHDEDAAADAARRELDKADTFLAETREGLASAEIALQAAEKAAEATAGTAPISDITIRANASYMQQEETWQALSKADRIRVCNAVDPRNV